jgi:acyl carrier protein
MTKLGKKKKAIEVFQTYGIHLTGQRKKADFYNELKMDKVFVDGLIFELEMGLGKELPDEKLPELTNPQKLLQELLID